MDLMVEMVGFQSWSMIRVVDLIVTAQMGGHMSVRMARDIWVGVDACSG